MTAVAIIQARLGSTRLPRKVLADIAGTSLIMRVIERVRAAPGVDLVVIATTADREDDELSDYLARHTDCPVFRGMRDDVLDRFYRCGLHYKADIVLRITADDPLKDPQVIEQALQRLSAEPALDYCSNTLEPTFPEGLDVEALRFSALARAHREAVLQSEREHVTPYIWKNPQLFQIANFRYQRDLSTWRWTVDKADDLEFMRAIYTHFSDRPLISYQNVIAWLETRPDVRAINAGTPRNEGYLKSLESERSQ